MATKMTEDEGMEALVRYPWDEWSDGDKWLIERGVDYKSSDRMFQVAARQYGRRNGYTVRTRKHVKGVVVQFLRGSAPAKKKLRRK
ncbi:hypothetical protein AB0J83_41520 [Actinoplanes sp. NPDC049596]|uniref:hypothetical protein n=1 Tax=unclassified Actinoplanes TaxID=2626549 RepID=UPI0034218E62